MDTRRLFAGVAVAATEALREMLAEWRRELKDERIRWSRLANLHLTVEFFGATAVERIPELERALAQAARRTPPFAMRFGGLGAFGDSRHPRVLWLGIESAGLHGLHDQVEASLRAAGWEPEPRPFSPHLTLGRMERLKDARRFGDVLARHREWPAPEQIAQELILYESRPGERGTEYVPLGRHPLSAQGPDRLFPM